MKREPKPAPRSEVVTFRVTPEEKTRLKALAAERATNLNTFMHQLMKNAKVIR